MRAGPHRIRAILSCLAAAGVFMLLAAPAGAPGRPREVTVVTVGGPLNVRPIAPGFLGLSFEYWAVPDYAGNDPEAVNPVFAQLIRNLAGGYPPVLRIGGVTTDSTWWPRPAITPPAGITYNLTHRWIAVARALAATLNARLVLGINLEADSATVARAEANALVNGIGRAHIEALELGNEPELYDAFRWGFSNSPGRPPGYDFADFEADFARIGRALPDLPLAGPAAGTPAWFKHLGRFLSDQPRVAVATLHRYPLQLCFDTPSQPIYPTVAHLLAPTATRSLADSVSAAAETAHAHHVSLRIDEMNSVSCGQHYVPGVTHTFASALWALDALFEMARVGVDGVNIHSYPDATYSPFAISRVCGQWRARVAPDYYGLEMFADAAPAGSRLLKISQRGAAHTDVWAVDAPDGTIHVVVINEDSRARNVDVRIPRGRARARATGALERLQAPSLLARNGVTIAGQRFGPETGLLQGRRRTFAVKATPAGAYRFDVPAASAALLTLPSS